MFAKRIGEITTLDIQSLVEGRTREHHALEYKETLPGSDSDGTNEFLFDVTAMANASGGLIVYGIADVRQGGQASGTPRIVGLLNVNLGQEMLRLENLLRDTVDPRLPKVELKVVDGLSQGPVLVLRVPKSWLAPHAVVRNAAMRFYGRNSSGKYPLSLDEIRSLFLLSASFAERARSFRDERILRVLADDGPAKLRPGPVVSAFFVPVSSLMPGARLVDLRSIFEHSELWSLIRPGGGYNRYNIDGFLHSGAAPGFASHAYTQYFRTGAVEAVASWESPLPNSKKDLPSTLIEQGVMAVTQKTMELYISLGVNEPVLVQAGLLRAKGYYMASGSEFDQIHTIDRDVVLSPDLLSPDVLFDVPGFMKPIIDSFWQASGRLESPNYRDGKWFPRGG